MTGFQLKSIVISTVCLSSIACIGIVIFAVILGCYIFKKRRSISVAASTKDLLSRKTDDSSTSDCSTEIDRMSVTVEKEPLEDTEGLSSFVTKKLRPPQTVLAGVGSLRQVSLSILYDLLLSLTHVRLKINPRETPPKNEQSLNTILASTSILQKNATLGSQCTTSDTKRRRSTTRQLHEPDKKDLEKQAVILEDLLQQDVRIINETDPSVEHSPAASVTDKNVHDQERQTCQLPVFMSEEEMTDILRVYVTKHLDYIFADDNRRHETFRSVMEAMMSAPTAQLLIDAIYRMFRVNHGVIQQWKVNEGSLMGIDPLDAQGDATLKVDFSLNNTMILWDGPSYGSDLLHSVSRLILNHREEGRQPTYCEYIAIHLAHYKLSHGCEMSHLPFKPIGKPGFSHHTQAYVSLTDPGKGHVVGTTRFKEWMNGIVLNVEKLETEGMSNADMIDFRVPPLLNLAQVRLHVGSSAPTTYFIGTAMKEEFEEQFEKDVHMAACTATLAFNYGSAVCRVCVCDLTSSQAVRFMRALKSKVNRQPGQLLSATWNLNKPIVDDYKRPEPLTRTSRKDVILTAAEMTSLAGFDIITLCGATETYSCKDIVSQIGFEEALTFNHEAHMRGLVTNFKSDAVKNAVFSGIDIVDTGEARMLRYMHQHTGMEESIPTILQDRDEAAKSVRGGGVHLLVRLDTMFFEGSIDKKQNKIRLKLFKALKVKCEHDIKAQLKALPEVVSLPDDSGHPLEGTVQRLTSSQEPLLKDVFESIFLWEHFLKRLRKALNSDDHDNLAEEYKSEPWYSYRQKYRDKMAIKTGLD